MNWTFLWDLSLRTKLVAMVASVIFVLALAQLLFFPSRIENLATDWAQQRARGIAQVLAAAISPSLEFEVEAGTNDLLGELKDVPEVQGAVVYGDNDKIFAEWQANNVPRLSEIVEPTSSSPYVYSNEMLYVIQPVTVRKTTAGHLVVAFSLDRLQREISYNRWMTLIVSITMLGLGVLGSWFVGSLLVRPIRLLTEATTRIVVEGDLTQKINIDSRDEVGQLAKVFQQMVDRMRNLPLAIRDLVEALVQVIERVTRASAEVSSSAAVAQSRSEETAGAMDSMLRSLRYIEENLGVLQENTVSSANANVEMVVTNEDMSQRIADMARAAVETSDAVERMTMSVAGIAQRVDEVNASTEETSVTITEMATSIKQVEQNAHQTAGIADQVDAEAQSGVVALQEVLSAIDEIGGAFREALDVNVSLGQRTAQIDSIVSVINEVAEQTNLLALNAAIIAAQAGDYGRGFAVVASEIKELAQRTQSSTKEIAALISGIQDESASAISTAQSGVQRVDAGVARGRETAVALSRISESANRAAKMVREIALATVEQASASTQVTSAIRHIVDSVQHINTATAEQARSSNDIRAIVQSMKLTAQQVNEAGTEQGRALKYIASSVERIGDMVNEVNAAQQTQTQSAAHTLEAARTIERATEQQLNTVQELGDAITLLQQNADQLKDRVDQFRV